MICRSSLTGLRECSPARCYSRLPLPHTRHYLLRSASPSSTETARLNRGLHTVVGPKSGANDVQPFRKQLKDEAKRRRRDTQLGLTPKSARATEAHSQKWELTVCRSSTTQAVRERNIGRGIDKPVAAATSAQAEPNAHVSVFDAALPGAQPAFQRETLIPALRAATALDCDIQSPSRFDRKHYFYRDQPNGYQITQYYEPLAKDGSITLNEHDGIAEEDYPSVSIGIKQIQMEQDTAKSLQQPPSTHLMDFNRVSYPLIEIITLPQIHSPATAAACVRKIAMVLKSVNACVLGMELGGLRADVNVSVCERSPDGLAKGAQEYSGVKNLGQRTEIKNLSSFKAVEEAIIAERDRQIRTLEAGGQIDGETRGWSLGSVETVKLRGKEGEVDYRYMPDPDLGPVILSKSLIDYIRESLPMLPDPQLDLLTSPHHFNLSLKDAKTLMSLDDGDRLDYYQTTVRLIRDALPDTDKSSAIGRTAGNWVLHELGGLLATSEKAWEENTVSERALADIVVHLLSRKITGRTAKYLLAAIFGGDAREVSQIVDDEDLALRPLSEEDYMKLAGAVIADHQAVVKQIREKGHSGKVQFLVGQMMRRGEDGRVEALKAADALRELLASNGQEDKA